MKNWKQCIISKTSSIQEAMSAIDRGKIQIALVCDAESGRLIGTVTDGDVRRSILSRISIDEPITKIMNPRPVTATVNDSREQILNLMRKKAIHQIPVVDGCNKLIRIEVSPALLLSLPLNNKVILMAGGLGSRLKPLTDNCPKPLLKVGKKPLLETILERFIEQGFQYFYIAINYKAQMIEDYFGDGVKWNIEIRYLREQKPMGTAGALTLLSETPNEPFLVMNGDVLTQINFRQLLDFHTSNNAFATMCVREHDFQVPYGVVQIDHHRIVSIDEKPIQKFFVNAGIYILNPLTLDLIQKNIPLDMPSIFRSLMKQSKEIIVFPIKEYWKDIGQIQDFYQANGDFNNFFS